MDNIGPDQMYVKDERFYMTYGDYRDGSINLWITDTSFNTTSTTKLDTVIPYAFSKFNDGKLYVLVQYEIDQGEYGGEFYIFNLHDLDENINSSIPKKEFKVQDFVITK